MDIRLTKYLKEINRFEPVYTGGNAFYVFTGNRLAVALNDFNITLFDITKNRSISTFSIEKEDINQFVVSPNE